jgi:Dyp-type peroxidase family
MAANDVNSKNIQGIGIAGFRKDHQHLLGVRLEDAKKAHPLLLELSHRTASAWEVRQFNDLFSELRSRGREDEHSVQATWVGTLISAAALTKLGVDLDELPAGIGFDAFKAGMAARAVKIGDTRPTDAPAQWLEQFRPGEGGVDLLIVAASDSGDQLDDLCDELDHHVKAHGGRVVFNERGHTLPGALRGHEHFGFKDGVSQPSIAGWDGSPAEGEPAAVPLGEFVLGYSDVEGATAALTDFWLDGSFAVFRRLRQDVYAFRQQAARGVAGSDPALDAPTTGAKLLGRWPSGASLETSPDRDDGNVTNAFGYAPDPEGFNAPRFAHVRKVNPRDEARVDSATEKVERHRMLRRGSPFGDPLPADATGDDGRDRGLHFISIVADLDRGFEFVQRQWMNDQNFPNGSIPPSGGGGPYDPPATPGEPGDGPDPIAGEFDPGAADALHQSSGVHPFVLMQEVVRVTAGEYFFAPSLSALAWLAEAVKRSGSADLEDKATDVGSAAPPSTDTSTSMPSEAV